MSWDGLSRYHVEVFMDGRWQYHYNVDATPTLSLMHKQTEKLHDRTAYERWVVVDDYTGKRYYHV